MALGYQRQDYYQAGARVPNGEAELFSTLGERLHEFSQFAKGIYEEKAIPQAQLAGSQAAAAGETKLRPGINRINRAYNDALVRAYALDAYADIHQKLSQLEIEAGTDVAKFQAAVAGYRSGKLPAMLPAAQPIIAEAIAQRELDGVQRIGTLSAVEGHAEAVAQSERGLTTIEAQISRLYTAGDPVSMERAEALTDTYLVALEGNVEGWLYTRRQADAKRDQMFKNVTRNAAIGRMEAALASGGDVAAVIEDTMKNASQILSDEERVALTADMLQRLNLHQAIEYEDTRTQLVEQTARWAEGEKVATQMLLRGQLTAGVLDRMVTDGILDPAIARSLRSTLKEGSGGVSDPRIEFLYRTNLLDLSEEEIRDESRLSWEDRATLIEKRRTLDGGWQDSNPAQEAKARIDRALGIVPGTLMQALSEEDKRARGMALSAWYDQVDALPDDQRVLQAIPVAEQVIKDIIVRNKSAEADRLETRLENAKKALRDASGKQARDTAQAEIDRLEKMIADARAKAPR
jgi:hypothetical protein